MSALQQTDLANLLTKRQYEFQLLAGVDIDTQVLSDRYRIAEIFLYKAIEEIIELRRTFPSQLNKWSKNQPEADTVRIMQEFADVMFYLSNFELVMQLDPSQAALIALEVQENNFRKLKAKKLGILYEEIIRNPTECHVGSGNIMPRRIFITEGDEPPKDFEPELDYHTFFTKNHSFSNEVIGRYWWAFLVQELAILTSGCNAEVLIQGEELFNTISAYTAELGKNTHAFEWVFDSTGNKYYNFKQYA